MTDDDKKRLAADPDGLVCYEYLANNIDTCFDDIDTIIDYLVKADVKGQFSASASRYLHAIDAQKYAHAINRLVGATIERDREHAYLADILTSLYGADYKERADELISADDNFRRIYKRLYPSPVSL